ncbi:hypothetical protein OSTOST_13575, partial [Ostertagia ostertagi]
MQLCRFCRGHRNEWEFRRSRSKENLLILLCVMLEKKKVQLPYAKDLYHECKRLRKRICKSHYEEAASYISDTVAVICNGAVEDLFSVPVHVEEELVARLEPHRVAIDASCELTGSHLVAFHCENTKDLKKEPQEGSKSFQSDDGSSFDLNEPRVFPMCTEATSIVDAAKQVMVRPHSTGNRRRPGGVALSHGSRKGVGLFPVRVKESTSLVETEKPAMVMISSGSTVDPSGILELDETDPKLLDEQFLITGSQLLKLFRFCPSCGTRIANPAQRVSLVAVGTTPVVHYICTACSPFEKRFEGQVEEAPHSSEVGFKSSTEIAMASVSTENMCEVYL